jgi:hypothetical protein
MSDEDIPMLVAKSNTKSIDIDASADKVFEFIANPLNWPQWVIVNLKSIARGKEGWYEMETRQGKGQLKMLADKSYGILDHQWKDAHTSWIVPARVIQNGRGSTFTITFFQPTVMSEEIFENLTAEIDIELATLKKILEQ